MSSDDAAHSGIEGQMTKLMARLDEFLQRFPLLSAIIVVTCGFGSMLGVVTPIFETPDDTYMKGIVSGTFCADTPSELMVYSNVLIGRVLKSLYEVTPQMPWYAYYLIVTHCVAYTLLLWGFLVVVPKVHVIGYFLIVMLGVGSRLLWHLSFTTTAFLAVESGIVLIVAHAAQNQLRSWQSIRAALAGGLLIVLGSLIRWHMFVMVSLLSIPLVAFVLLWKTDSKKKLYYLTVGIVTLSMVQSAAVYDQSIYQSSPAWIQFQRLNVYAYWIADLAKPRELLIHPEETHDILQQAGWSANDFLMANNWFFMDPEVYSEEAMQSVSQSWLKLQAASAQTMIALIVAMYRIHLTSNVGLACVVTTIFAIFVSGARWTRIRCSVPFGLALILMALLSVTHKLPGRVALPVLLVAMTSTILLSILARRDLEFAYYNNTLDYWKLLVAGVTTALLIISVKNGFRRQEVYQTSHRHFWADIQKIVDRGDALVIFWSPFPYGLLLPTDDLHAMDGIGRCVLGAVQRTPHTQLQLSNRGIDNVMKSISEGKTIAVLGGPEQIQLLTQFIQEHYGVSLKYTVAFRGKSGFQLFQAELIEKTKH